MDVEYALAQKLEIFDFHVCATPLSSTVRLDNNMKKLIATLICFLFIGCASADPIDTLVTKLSNDHVWQNGAFPIIDLPETAPNADVVAQCFKMTGFDQRHIKTYRIIQTRKVKIRGSLPDDYFAALIDSDLGKKIVLFQYKGTAVGWWTRVYDQN
ncbi:hypothetical protein KAR91_36525 [Candidatus Pacearchaeota archaeon]|nr:hypothetical protein [Candidatus Pacearchaeota archaeon]